MNSSLTNESNETHTLTYLSVDIGIRNLAYCIVEMPACTIKQWEKIDILRENGIEIKNATRFVHSKLFRVIHTTLLKRLYWWQQLGIDIVLIEQQLGHSRNAKMEGMIAMWLHTHLQKPIHMVSPSWKLRLKFDEGGWSLQDKLHFANHGQRKDFAIQLVDKWLHATQKEQPTAYQFFTKHKGKTKKLSKQDDLADALLQAVAFHLKSQTKEKNQEKINKCPNPKPLPKRHFV